MYVSMVDIQSATAEIRRGKKERRKKKLQLQVENIMSASAAQGGHKNITNRRNMFFAVSTSAKRISLLFTESRQRGI